MVKLYFRLLFLFSFILISFTATAQRRSFFDRGSGGTMTQRWELDTLSTSGTFIVTPYKPIYLLPVRWSSNPEGMPQSGNTDDAYINEENLKLNPFETKFQLSFKTKFFQGMFWGYGDLWGAYSQKSHWQVYNTELSRPFREIDYEPELILNFATNYTVFGFRGRMAAVGYNHESNGREQPMSRSWNRVIFMAGFDRGPWQIYLRPWIRIHDESDDNPNITRFMGNGDATISYEGGKSIFSLIARHNMRLNQHSKGYAEFSWAYQIKGNLKANLQITHGYGETLIDYNNRQTTVGLGVSLIEWM